MSRNEPTPDEHRSPYVPNESAHPWRRMVAIGDSFTEGIGDPIPGTSDDHRGWADRVAEVLGAQVDDFAYANLAVRGKLIGGGSCHVWGAFSLCSRNRPPGAKRRTSTSARPTVISRSAATCTADTPGTTSPRKRLASSHATSR